MRRELVLALEISGADAFAMHGEASGANAPLLAHRKAIIALIRLMTPPSHTSFHIIIQFSHHCLTVKSTASVYQNHSQLVGQLNWVNDVAGTFQQRLFFCSELAIYACNMIGAYSSQQHKRKTLLRVQWSKQQFIKFLLLWQFATGKRRRKQFLLQHDFYSFWLRPLLFN